MPKKTYADLISSMPDGVANGTTAADVRSIPESFSRQRTLGTLTGTGIATPTSFTRVALTQYGSAITNGITWSGNYLILRDSNISGFGIAYDIQGEFESTAIIRTKLRYGLTSAAPSLDLPQSGMALKVAGADPFSISKYYEIPSTVAGNTTIDLTWKTDVAETINNLEIYISIWSLPPNYGGA
jgi:hypothetical protein